MGRGLGLGLDCIGRLGGVVQERDGVQKRKEAPTGGVHLSVGGGDGADTLLGRRDSGPGPNSGLGQNRPPIPRPFILFSISFPFSFLFPYLIQSLSANFIQTNSNKVLNYSNIYCNVLNQ
jgi:hypothetical protein